MKTLLFLIFVLLCGPVLADLTLPRIFSDHMVLQQGKPIMVWGWGELGERVTIAISNNIFKTSVRKNGTWKAKMPAMPIGGPYDMIVTGNNTNIVHDVMVGEVWLCSGQSNMEWPVSKCNAPDDIATADYPQIRCIKVERKPSANPLKDISGAWSVCTPETVGQFTAVGYFFGREIHEKLDVPIGIIDVNWGGTRIEPWTPYGGFAAEPGCADIVAQVDRDKSNYEKNLPKALDTLELWIGKAREALKKSEEIPQLPEIPRHHVYDGGRRFGPSSLFNGMINPLVPYTIRGVLWYQGEANGREGEKYYHKMRALIGGWRDVWKQGDFPFYFVQLANIQKPNDNPAGGDGWARIRCAQTKSLQITNTGMAVAIDIGEENDIHPKNKQDVGKRLALWALAHPYKGESLVYSGPLYKSMKVEDGKIRLFFKHTGGGLMIGRKDGTHETTEDRDGKLAQFAIAGKDKQWYWADAIIDGNTVVVSSENVPEPVAVRYAYSMNPEGCNLYNKEGLPASPFRTDNW
jgi:sialate O-acetylesterase